MDKFDLEKLVKTNNIANIQDLLKKELPETQFQWLQSVVSDFKNDNDEKNLFFNFSLCSRQLKGIVGKYKVFDFCPAMNLIEWSRNYILLSYINQISSPFFEIYKKLKVTADLHETLALYKGICLYPYSEDLKKSAEEGLRSNMKEVFESVALDNDFPAKHFEEESWNQMILKALFVEAPIYRIKNFESRKNEELSRMVTDYALERIAASRSIHPELWRCVKIVENKRILDHWQKLLESGNEIEQSAIKLTLDTQLSEVKNIGLASSTKKYPLKSWEEIGQALEKQRKGIS